MVRNTGTDLGGQHTEANRKIPLSPLKAALKIRVVEFYVTLDNTLKKLRRISVIKPKLSFRKNCSNCAVVFFECARHGKTSGSKGERKTSGC